MGGNALAHLGVQRLTSAEVNRVHDLVRLELGDIGVRAHLVPWIPTKHDHGDVDIVVDTPNLDEVLAALSGYLDRGTSINGNVASVPFVLGDKLVQVDLIGVSPANFAWTCFYHSGGDFGLYVGRIAAHKGYVFSSEDFRVRASSMSKDGGEDLNWIKDLQLTSDVALLPRVFEILNLGWPVPYFETYEQMWGWVTANHSTEIFQPAQTNAENRSRDKLRPTFQKFLDWAAGRHVDRALEPKPTLESISAEVLRYWGVLTDDHVQKCYRLFEDTREANLWAGSGVIRSLTNTLYGAELGKAVNALTAYLPPRSERLKCYRLSPEAYKLMCTYVAVRVLTDLGHLPRSTP